MSVCERGRVWKINRDAAGGEPAGGRRELLMFTGVRRGRPNGGAIGQHLNETNR